MSLIRGAPECGWEWGVDGRNELDETRNLLEICDRKSFGMKEYFC